MNVKLFPVNKNQRTLSLDDMRTPDPRRTPTDFSDPDYQDACHLAAGYTLVGETDKSTDGTLEMFTKDGVYYRAQNGKLWAKQK